MAEVRDRQVGVAPVAILRLHDGQVVDVAVLARVLEDDGRWWYRVSLDLPMRVQGPDGRLSCEPSPVEFQAPADRVTARPDQDYTAVPTVRSPAALRAFRGHRPRRGPRGGASAAPPDAAARRGALPEP
ncbi:hypothetical protein GCM10027168_13600 [Streptomyces capparidis]